MSLNIGGFDILRNPNHNKDLGFNDNERKIYSLRGILPPLILDIDKQTELFLKNLRAKSDNLEKYCYLMDMYSKNIKLFFYAITKNTTELMPYIYTPTVGLACQNFGKIYNNARGLFITIDDANNISAILNQWPIKGIKAICVTDGERILGLGDLGAHGMGIPIGKLALYTALGGVDPSYCLPITLDVGTNNKKLIEDPFYLGLKRTRLSDEKYEKFVDEFMQSCVSVYGSDVLIQFEDFGNFYAFYFLQKYRNAFCMFNDDIQGTASVIVAGIITAMKGLNKRVADNKFVFFGCGEASLGIANLLIMLMEEDGLDIESARKLIFMIDSKGLIVENRPKGGLTPLKAIFAQKMNPIDTLLEAVQQISPTVLIGASSQPGSFTAEVLKTMVKATPNPLIMALSNPTSKAECTAQEAYDHTNGAALFASGSPFDPCDYNGKMYYPGQANNSYIFPGVAFAIIHSRIHPIHDKMFLSAAKGLARQVTTKDIKCGRLYPKLENIMKVSLEVSVACCEYAYRHNLAHLWPEPTDKAAFLLERYYLPKYENLMATTD